MEDGDADGINPLVAMVMDVCACDERKATRALAMAGQDPNTAIELVLTGHPRLGLGPDRGELSPPRLPGGGSMGGGGGEGGDGGGDEDVVEMIQWGLSESAAKYALLQNNFNRQQAVEWWFTVPEGEQLRLNSTDVPGDWEMYRLAHRAQTDSCRDLETVEQLLSLLGGEGTDLLDEMIMKALKGKGRRTPAELKTLLDCGVLDRMAAIVHDHYSGTEKPESPAAGSLVRQAFGLMQRLCRESKDAISGGGGASMERGLAALGERLGGARERAGRPDEPTLLALRVAVSSTPVLTAVLSVLFDSGNRNVEATDQRGMLQLVTWIAAVMVGDALLLLEFIFRKPPGSRRSLFGVLLRQSHDQWKRGGGGGGDESRAEYQQYVICVVLILDSLNRALVKTPPGEGQDRALDRLNAEIVTYTWKMAGIAQILSDCRSDTEDVLALRLTDAMLMCNPNATSTLLRHGLLRAVQELTPPLAEDEGGDEVGDEVGDSDDDIADLVDTPPPPPFDDEEDASAPAALADGEIDPEQEQEVPQPAGDAPAAEEMDSPPSPRAGGEAGWVVNCVTDEPSGPVVPFRQSCIYAFQDCVAGQLESGMAVVAPHPDYGQDKLWSAEVVEADIAPGLHDESSTMVQLRYADDDEATPDTSECCIVATEPTAEAPGTGTEVLVLFRQNDFGPEYRRMRVTDEMPEPGNAEPRDFAEGMPGDEEEEEEEEIDPRLRTPLAFGDEVGRAEMDELLYSQQVIEERLRASGLEQAFLDAAGGGLGGIGEVLGHLQGDQDADNDLRDMLERDIQFGSVGSIADMARRVLGKLQEAECPQNDAVVTIAGLRTSDDDAVTQFGKMLWQPDDGGMTAYEFEEAHCATALLRLGAKQLQAVFAPKRELVNFANSLKIEADETDDEKLSTLIEQTLTEAGSEGGLSQEKIDARMAELEGASGRRYKCLGFMNLLSRLHDVVASTDMLPVWQFHRQSISWTSFSGRSFYGKPITVCFTQAEDSARFNSNLPLKQYLVDGMHSAAELQRLVLQNVRCTDPRFLSFCQDLIGCTVELKSSSSARWRKAQVESFDAETGRHVFRYSSGQQVKALLSSGDVEYRILERGQVEPVPQILASPQRVDDDLPDGATLNIAVARNEEARAGYTVHRNELIVAESEPGSVAYENGMRAGYRITHVDGEEVNTWSDYLRIARPRAEFNVTVEVAPDMDRPDSEVWFWQVEDRRRHSSSGRWKRFDERSQGLLDATFNEDSNGHAELDLPNGTFVVDFGEMIQINEETGSRHVVRRCQPSELEPSRGSMEARLRRGGRRGQGECWYRTWDGFDLQSSEEKAREYSRGGRLVETDETAMGKTLYARKENATSVEQPLARPVLKVELTFGGFGVEKDSRKPRHARALNDFQAQPDMDGYYRPLEFKEGDMIEVSSKEPGGGWWTGKLHGKSGLIPAGYVRLEEEDEEAQVRDQFGTIGAPILMQPRESLLSVLMRATEVEDSGNLAGIWRVEISDSGSDPEEVLWLMSGVDDGKKYVGARLDGGKLTGLIEGQVQGDGTFAFTQSGRSGVLNRMQGAALTGTIGPIEEGGERQHVRAARVGDSTSQAAVPFGALCNVQFRVVVVPGKSMSPEMEPEPSALSAQPEPEPEPESGEPVHVAATFTAALKLLTKLHERRNDWQRILGVGLNYFENPAMSRKLEEQLSDPVSVASGSLPTWCRQWMQQGSFLFARSLRERFLHVTAFGPTRALVYMNSLTGGADGTNRRVSGGRLGQMPELKPDKWIVRRDPITQFLDDVDAVLSQRAAAASRGPRRAARTRLEVNIEFRVGGSEDGEAFTGAGQGVHVQFYTEVARVLESSEEQKRLRVWMDEAGTVAVVTEAAAQPSMNDDWLPSVEETIVSAVSAIRQDSRIAPAEQQRYIAAWRSLRDGGGAAVEPSLDGGGNTPCADDTNSGEYTPLQCSLYPRALLPQESAEQVAQVGRRFRLLGRCMATALLERQLLPLQLHTYFITLALGRDSPTTTPAVSAPEDLNGAEWMAGLRELSGEGEVRGAAVIGWVLEALGQDEAWPSFLGEVYFTDPAHPAADAPEPAARAAAALHPDGESELLTRENAEEYLRSVHDAWCGGGVAQQLVAFRAGFADIVPAGIDITFASFTAAEVSDMICGAAISWDEATLRACIVPAPAPPTYEVGEDHMEWLIAELLEMGPQARSVFLNFVTARRRLPGGDLRNLPVLAGSGAVAGVSSPLRRGTLGGHTNKLSGRITVDASSDAAPLMKGSTCSYRLHMPRVYGNREELRDHLYRSMAWSSGMHD